MSVVSLPVTRTAGRALVIANPALQPAPMQLLQQLGFETHVAPDPYAAMAELCASAAGYRSVVLSLQSCYREEIALVGTLRRRFPHLEIWLTQTDGRQAALAEAMRLGADGLLADDGLHRIAASSSVPELSVGRPLSDSITLPSPPDPQEEPAQDHGHDEPSVGEPVLTADELRALLQEQPSMPPSSGSEN